MGARIGREGVSSDAGSDSPLRFSLIFRLSGNRFGNLATWSGRYLGKHPRLDIDTPKNWWLRPW